MNEDFSLVIQGSGAGAPTFLTGLESYSKTFGSIVVATNGPLPDEVCQKALDICPRMVLLDTELINIPANVYNGGNVYFQAISTLLGVRNVPTEFIIKTRADEYYGNLEPVIQMLRENPNKIIYTDIYFYCDKVSKYHISDHLIAVQSQILEKAMEGVIHQCENELAKSYILNVYIPPEQIIGSEIFKAKNIQPEAQRSIENMRDNVIIVPRRELHPYTISTLVRTVRGTERRFYTDTNDTFWLERGAIDDIEDIGMTSWAYPRDDGIPYYARAEYDWERDFRWQMDTDAIEYHKQLKAGLKSK